MKYLRILCAPLVLILLVLSLLACSSIQDTSPDSSVSDKPDTVTASQSTDSTIPSETSNPIESTSSQTPDTTQVPMTSRPVNTFSPIDPAAGKAFLSESDVSNVRTTHGISRFLILTKNNPSLPFNVACQITDSHITAMLPDGIDLTSLTVQFKTQSTVFLDGKEIKSGDTIDASSPRNLTVKKDAGAEYNVVLDIQTLRTGLPSVALTVEEFAEINSKDYYFTSTFFAGGGDPVICDYATEQTILIDAEAKGRGNTSWGFEKKGFTVKLAEKKNLLGLGKSRNWVLISSYQDKTLMRNEIAAHLSEHLGLPTMSTRSVDLWLNGSYWGTYLLIEKIEFENERLDYPDYDEVEDPADAGLLLEWDGHVGEVSSEQKRQWVQVTEHTYYDPVANINFIRLDGSYIVIHKPNADNILFEQIERAETIVIQTHAALQSHDYDQLKSTIDFESFAAWYLVEDIMKNMDAQLHSSCYMHVGSDGILHMGPVWDFDMSLGNANYGGINDPTGAYISTKRWFKYLFETEEFCQLVNDMLTAYKDDLDAVPNYMDTYATMLERSQTFNFERWDILDIKVGFNPQNVIEANTYQKQIDLMKSFYTVRLSEVQKIVTNACQKSKQ